MDKEVTTALWILTIFILKGKSQEGGSHGGAFKTTWHSVMLWWIDIFIQTVRYFAVCRKRITPSTWLPWKCKCSTSKPRRRISLKCDQHITRLQFTVLVDLSCVTAWLQIVSSFSWGVLAGHWSVNLPINPICAVIGSTVVLPCSYEYQEDSSSQVKLTKTKDLLFVLIHPPILGFEPADEWTRASSEIQCSNRRSQT